MKSSLSSFLIAVAFLVGLVVLGKNMWTKKDATPIQTWQLAKSVDELRGSRIDGAFLQSLDQKPLYFGLFRSYAELSVVSTDEIPLNIGIEVPGTMVSCLRWGCKAYLRFDKGPVKELTYATGGFPMASRVSVENPREFYNQLISNDKLMVELELADFSIQQFTFKIGPLPDSFAKKIVQRNH